MNAVDETCSSHFVHKTYIQVNTEEDEERCWITGIASLTYPYLVLADSKNISIKLIDLSNNSVVDQLKLENYPLDVAVVEDSTCAITVPVEQTIRFISVTDETLLLSDKKLQVGGECRGLTLYKERFVVTYSCPAKLQIIDLDGTVLKTVMVDAMQYLIFSEPYYVAATNNHIIISDLGEMGIKKLNWNGEVLGSFSCDGPPHGVSVTENGFQFVSGKNIKQCNQRNEIEDIAKDFQFPYAINYSETNKNLVVSFHKGSSEFDNNIQVLEKM